MSLIAEYTLFQLAAHFLEKENFKILHMNEEADELWLIRMNKNKSEIIRLAQQEFNWKNQLQNDIKNVFRKIHLMKKSFHAKKIEIYNVYVNTAEPVDEWETLKQPIILKQKEPVKMKVFYLSPNVINSEKDRLFHETESVIHKEETDLSQQEKSAFIKLYKTKIFNKIAKRNESERKKQHTYGNARINYLFVSLNVLLFFILNLIGKNYFTQVYDVLLFNKTAIINGEMWRVITSLFIHNSIIHIVLTVLVLYYLGTLVERNYGSLRFAIIFFVAGIGANLTAFAFSSNNLLLGTTGALFGLLGALLSFTLYYRWLYLETIGKNIIAGFVILVLLSVIFPQFEIYPYISSFIIGFIATNVTFLPQKKAYLLQITSGILLLLIFSLLVVIGLY